MVTLTLLGTGGGRFTTMHQTRSTGGMLIDTGKTKIHLDPGPGALTNMHRIGYDLCDTDAILISHCHPDHYSDAEVAIEGMTFGGCRMRGSLYGSASVMEGHGGFGPAISEYHRSLPEYTQTVKPGDVCRIGDAVITMTSAKHNDPTSVGYIIETSEGRVSYVTDTEYTEKIADQYIGSKILFLPVTTPDGRRVAGHMCTDDAAEFIARVKPELAVFMHFGDVMLKYNPVNQATETEKRTGARTIAGDDLMSIDVESLAVSLRKPVCDE